MDFTSERNKPIFVTRPSKITSFSTRQILTEALANETALRAKRSDDYMVKLSAARRLPKETLIPITESTPDEVKDLVITRLESDQAERFEFLDGRIFSGREAAKEVRENTRVGGYFLDLEKETLRIVQGAFFDGELH